MTPGVAHGSAQVRRYNHAVQGRERRRLPRPSPQTPECLPSATPRVVDTDTQSLDFRYMSIDNRYMIDTKRAGATGTLISLAVLGVGTVLMQIVAPLVAVEIGQEYPEVSHLVVPYSIAADLTVLAAQVGLVGLWIIVVAVARGRLFDSATRRWIVALRWCVVVATLIPAVVAAHLLFFVNVGGFGVILGLFAALAVGAGAYMLLTTATRAYDQAAADHSELAGVI